MVGAVAAAAAAGGTTMAAGASASEKTRRRCRTGKAAAMRGTTAHLKEVGSGIWVAYPKAGSMAMIIGAAPYRQRLHQQQQQQQRLLGHRHR